MVIQRIPTTNIIPPWRRQAIVGRETQKLWTLKDKRQAVCGLYKYGYEVAELVEGLNLTKSKIIGILSSSGITFRHSIRKISPEEWEQRKAQYHHRCSYCGKRSKSLERDHIIPLYSSGGDGIDNIVPACSNCNRSKNKLALLDWSKFRALQLSL